MSEKTQERWQAIQLRQRIEPFAPACLFDDGLWAILDANRPETLPIAVIDRANDHHAPTRAEAGVRAQLMAAAPAMLEALSHLIYRNHETSPGCSGCVAAVDLLTSFGR